MATTLETGAQLPDFRVRDDTGAEWSSDTIRGSWALIWWYPKADTPGCTAEGVAFTEHADEFREFECSVVGVSFDTPEDNAAFKAKYGFPFTLLSDPDRSLGAVFGVIRDPDDQYAEYPKRLSFLFDPSGTLVTTYKVDNPADHADDVLDDLGELAA